MKTTTTGCGGRKKKAQTDDLSIAGKLKKFFFNTAVGSYITILVLFSPVLVMAIRYWQKKQDALKHEGVNVEAVVFYSKWRKDRGGPPYRDIKVYFHLNGEYEEQRIHAYPPKHSSSVPNIDVGDTVYVRVVPRKPEYIEYLSKKIHRIP